MWFKSSVRNIANRNEITSADVGALFVINPVSNNSDI